ncbi:MAG: hypothetical protein ABEL76_03060 [Bradymonadaceae bacterium]
MLDQPLFRRAVAVVPMVAMLLGTGCGASRDQPGDCRSDEFYNESTRRCISCPVVTPPTCRSGCGYRITTDGRGCPKAVCRDTCDACPEGERYSEDRGMCVSCPEPPDCGALSCEGELVVEPSTVGVCPDYACGECTAPYRGCASDEQGTCIDR